MRKLRVKQKRIFITLLIFLISKTGRVERNIRRNCKVAKKKDVYILIYFGSTHRKKNNQYNQIGMTYEEM